MNSLFCLGSPSRCRLARTVKAKHHLRYFGLVAAGLLSLETVSASQSSSPGKDAISELLTGAKSWTVYFEHGGDTIKPSERAGIARYEFFRRGSDVVGRTIHQEPAHRGEFPVVVRDSGFDFKRCCGYAETVPMTSVEYDPGDPAYPFKRVTTPQKIWLMPQR